MDCSQTVNPSATPAKKNEFYRRLLNEELNKWVGSSCGHDEDLDFGHQLGDAIGVRLYHYRELVQWNQCAEDHIVIFS